MAICTACRRKVENPTVGTVGDNLTVRLCDPCEEEIVGGNAYKRLRFPANVSESDTDESGGE